MKKNIILDTGCITLQIAKNPPKKITILFDNIEKDIYSAFVVTPVITEVYKHLCVEKGKQFASSSIISLLDRYSLQLVDQDLSLLLRAGDLKCSYRTKLSYIDCFVLAAGLLYKWEIHTTEKSFPNIPHLKVVSYQF